MQETQRKCSFEVKQLKRQLLHLKQRTIEMIEAREKDIEQLQIQIQVEKASMEHEIESVTKQLKE